MRYDGYFLKVDGNVVTHEPSTMVRDNVCAESDKGIKDAVAKLGPKISQALHAGPLRPIENFVWTNSSLTEDPISVTSRRILTGSELYWKEQEVVYNSYVSRYGSFWGFVYYHLDGFLNG